MTQPAAMIGHHTWLMADPQAPPEYKLYRTRPRLPGRGGDDGSMLDELRGAPPKERRRKPITVGRVVKWLALALVAWIGLSLVLFLISRAGQPGPGRPPPRRPSWRAAASGSLKPQTTLILGSDQRTAGTKEPGASTSGPEPQRLDPARAHRRRPQRQALDPARHRRRHPRPRAQQDQRGLRDRRRRAHGADRSSSTSASRSTTSSRSTSTTSRRSSTRWAASTTPAAASCRASTAASTTAASRCACSRGTTHIDGKQALALARTRHNLCNPKENDLTRARRQQKVISADEVARVQPRRLHPPAVDLLERAEDAQDRHARAGAAGLRDRHGAERQRQDRDPQALGRRDAARRRRRPRGLRRREAGRRRGASCDG